MDKIIPHFIPVRDVSRGVQGGAGGAGVALVGIYAEFWEVLPPTMSGLYLPY